MKSILAVFCVLCFLASVALGGNRFPVLTYSDDSRVDNREQFYQWLVDWGASDFYGVTDSVSKYKNLNDLDLTIAGAHFHSNQKIWLDSLKQLELNLGKGNLVTSFGWNAVNSYARLGYKPGQALVGETEPDPAVGRDVRQALVLSHSAGLIHSKFAKYSVYRKVPKRTPIGHSCTFEIMLRILDRSGDQNAVVAQMRFSPDSNNAVVTTRDISVGEFANTTSYHRFQMPILVDGDHATYKYEVYWYDIKDIFLDSLRVYDSKGLRFDTIVRDSADSARQRIIRYYTAHPDEMSAVSKLYLVDEPTGAEFPQYEAINRLIALLPASMPRVQMTTLGPYVHGTVESDPTYHSYFDAFYQFSQQNHLLYDDYLNWCFVTSATDGQWDKTNFQFQMSNAFIPHLQIARQRAIAENPPKDFRVTIPTWAGYDSIGFDGQKIYRKTHRLPTDGETWTMANLALLYGARGIAYWEYIGRGGSDHYIAGKAQLESNGVEPEPEIQEQNTQEFQAAPPGYGSAPASCYACSTLHEYQLPYIFKGMFRIVDGAAVREPLWYTTRSINRYLDSMAYFFLNAELQGTSSQTGDLTGVGGSFLDSIVSLSGYSHPFIETGFFSFQGQSYAFILNRRADDGTCAQLDTQTVKLFMSGEGLSEVTSLYQDQDGEIQELIDSIYDSCGVMTWNRQLAPGKAMLVKKRALKEYWRGTLAANETWPSFATIRLTGDLTVPAGKTLTIQGGRPRIQSYVDSSHAGVDVNRTEINVYGVLRAEAPAGDSIVISPQTYEDTARAAWRGIKVFANGKVYLNRVRVRGAVSGLETQHTEVDTVMNSRFENCLSHGIHSILAPLYLYADTFVCHDTLALTDYGLRIDGPHGFIEIEEEMGSEGGGEELLGGGGGGEEMIVNGIGPGRTVVDARYCVFKEVKYPIYAIGARPTINNCKFDCAKIKGGANPAAVHIDTNSIATISYSQILNYGTGIRVDKGTNVSVERCTFSSTHFWSDNHGPSMYAGIDADSAAYSTCVVRSCCFLAIDYRSVVSDNNIVDLGNLFEAGHNNFFIDTVSAVKAFPERYIVNNSTDTLQAMGNYFAIAGGVEGPIDTSFSTSLPSTFCEGPIGGEFKLANSDNTPTQPRTIEVEQNYPNPFNPTTEIRFFIPRSQHVRVEVLNLIGQKVTTLVDSDLSTGEHMVRWSGLDQSGNRVASGVYLYRFEANNYHVTKKMILLK